MKGRAMLAAVLGVIVVLLGWNMFFFGPAGEDLDDAKTDRNAARSENADLNAELSRLELIAENQPDFIEEQAKFGAMIPQQTDLAAFLRSANDIADESGLDWLQITPAEPTPGASGASEIAMTMQLEGGYYQVLEYLKELEDLSRIVVIDTIQVNAGSLDGDVEGTTGSGNIPSVTGAPTLSVNITARMFTQATVVARPSPEIAEDPTATTTIDDAATSSTGESN